MLTLFSVVLLFLTAACSAASTPAAVSAPAPQATASPISDSTPSGDVIALPPPSLKGKLSLEETLQQRRSQRSFTETPLTLAELGQLLWAAQGITGAENGRTAPSAGALYPLELYLLTSDGIFHYEPSSHRLTVLARDDRHRALFDAALQQSAVRDAPAVIVVTADYARTEVKYGEDRTPRYVQLEAGHAAQNILLQAVALGLGAAPIGAFEDDKVQSALGTPTSHRPLYLIPVGHPK